MKKIISVCLLVCALLIFAACKPKKPKPVSNNITKTTVTINGKKDSVINNNQLNYGTATISEPCAKILLSNIKGTVEYRKITALEKDSSISWVLNWVKAANPRVITNGGKITNGLEAVFYKQEGATKRKIGSFLYNNENARMYYVNKNGRYSTLEDVKADELAHIRNACYWGVASHR